jgi:hypothetical protein
MGSMGEVGECASVEMEAGELGPILRPAVFSDGLVLMV